MNHTAPDFDAVDHVAPAAGLLEFHRASNSGADTPSEHEPVDAIPHPGQDWTIESSEAFIRLHEVAVADAMAELEHALRSEYPDGTIETYRYTAWTLVRYLSPRGPGECQPLGSVSVRVKGGVTASGTVAVRWRDGRILINRHPPVF